MTVLKTLLFTLLVPGTVAALIPWLLLTFVRFLPPLPLGPFRYAGPILLSLGVVIYLWCAAEFTFRGRGTPSPTDPPRELVVTGPYRYSRNPMYVGVVAALLGITLWFASLEMLLYTCLVLLGFHLRIIHHEEPALARSFGDAFRRYRRKVPRWILRPDRGADERTPNHK